MPALTLGLRMCELLLLLMVMLLISGLSCAQNVSVTGTCNHCPSGSCTTSWTIECGCTADSRVIKISDKSNGSNPNASLGFVVDTTGSMKDTIIEVKGFVKNLVEAGNQTVNKYVLASVNDPYKRNLIETAKAEDLLKFVNNLTAHGGKDCPEPTLTGIKDVEQLVSKGSIIFVFTDADASDGELIPSLVQQLKAKDVRLHVVMVSATFCSAAKNNSTLEQLIKALDGTLYPGESVDVAKSVLTYVGHFLRLGAEFVRAMPASIKDLESFSKGKCTRCSTTKTLQCRTEQPIVSDSSVQPSGGAKAIVVVLVLPLVMAMTAVGLVV